MYKNNRKYIFDVPGIIFLHNDEIASKDHFPTDTI